MISMGQKGCSNRVAMHLLVNGAALPIAQMGPDFLLLDKRIDHPPGEATIVFSVEGHSERRWLVRLPEGMSSASERVSIARP
ncbi:hypothetical protein BH18VER2_BH18VER2_16030 [soil metagenome]